MLNFCLFLLLTRQENGADQIVKTAVDSALVIFLGHVMTCLLNMQ